MTQIGGHGPVRLHLVRHGRAAAGFGDHLDPGLDDAGRAQAVAAARELAGLGPLPVLTSPSRRARETAAPLAALWRNEPVVEPAVGEIPSPTADLAERSAWLRTALRRNWTDLGSAVDAWRRQLVATLVALPGDTVVFTHFVAVNAVVGAATGQDALVLCMPANASCTVVDVEAGRLAVVRLGEQAGSTVR